MNKNYRATGEYIFRGIEYLVTLQTLNNGTTLCVEVEDKVTADQWRGTFESSYIEDLTHKTGNFKQFDVFVSMLESALDKSTDSVTLDLLTFTDLERLRSRKAASAGKPDSRQRAPATKQQESKRYLILVYSVEFDRIHYPLPLPFQGKPDPVHLQRLVRQLNDEITKLKSGRSLSGQDEEFLRLKEDYETLLQEKQEIEAAFEEMKLGVRNGGKAAVSKEVKVLKKVVQNLELEMMKEKNRFQRQMSKKTADVKRLTVELNDLTARERTLQIRVKSLTNELAMYKRSRTPLNTEPRPDSRVRYSASRNSVSRNGSNLRPTSSAATRRSASRGSQSGSFYRRPTSSSRERPLSSAMRERSSSGDKRISFSRDGRRSRTPTPHRLARFNPTSYVEEKKRKLLESQERAKRRTSAGFIPSSNQSRGRTRSRYSRDSNFSSSKDRLTSGGSLRKRSGSLESRNSSDNGSITRGKTRSNGGRRPAWQDSPEYSALNDPRRLSSTPDVTSRYGSRKKMASNDADIDEIDARLDALQQYMREIQHKA